jgi:magnesium chelatase family protein
MDELGEFQAAVLDSLRQPLEEGVIRVARAANKAEYPARVLLVAAMNPCPCGDGVSQGACRCSPASRARYARRLSGPLVDRFDLRVEVGRPRVAELLAAGEAGAGEPSAAVARRVAGARELAAERGVATNAQLPASRLDDVAPVDGAAARLLERVLRAGRLTGRGLGGVRRVARTVADLAGDDGALSVEHVSAALALRAEPTFLDGRAA